MASAENLAVIVGRIEIVQQSKGRFYHDVKLPAADEYAAPGWAKVVADRSLGSPGTILKCRARIAGYRRVFEKKDGSQGTEINSIFNYEAVE